VETSEDAAVKPRDGECGTDSTATAPSAASMNAAQTARELPRHSYSPIKTERRRRNATSTKKVVRESNAQKFLELNLDFQSRFWEHPHPSSTKNGGKGEDNKHSAILLATES